jgi:hypothetical protein
VQQQHKPTGLTIWFQPEELSLLRRIFDAGYRATARALHRQMHRLGDHKHIFCNCLGVLTTIPEGRKFDSEQPRRQHLRADDQV